MRIVLRVWVLGAAITTVACSPMAPTIQPRVMLLPARESLSSIVLPPAQPLDCSLILTVLPCEPAFKIGKD